MSAARRGAVAVAVIVAALAFAAGARAQREAGWEIRATERLELVAGTPGTIAIVIAVDRGLTISKDAGIYIDLAPPAGVVVKRRRWQRTDAVDPDADEPRFAIPVRAEAPTADAPIAVHVRFWVCGGKVCRPVDVRRSVTIAVTAAPPPADGPAVDAGVPDAAAPPDAPPAPHARHH